MSLDWNVANVKDFKKVCWVDESENSAVNPITEALIWATMSVGLNKITKKNLDAWYVRLTVLSKLFGPPMYNWEDGKRTDRNITLAELQMHIGLYTNADSYTDAVFWKTVRKRADGDFKLLFKQAQLLNNCIIII